MIIYAKFVVFVAFLAAPVYGSAKDKTTTDTTRSKELTIDLGADAFKPRKKDIVGDITHLATMPKGSENTVEYARRFFKLRDMLKKLGDDQLTSEERDRWLTVSVPTEHAVKLLAEEEANAAKRIDDRRAELDDFSQRVTELKLLRVEIENQASLRTREEQIRRERDQQRFYEYMVELDGLRSPSEYDRARAIRGEYRGRP